MRKVESTQYELGASIISNVSINPKSRDDIPALLIGLQHLYTDTQTRDKMFALLEAEVNPGARKDTGRPGMELWRILVLATLKQGLNCDYDRLTHIANHDNLVRQMMGHGLLDHAYERQTVADNVRLLSPQLLEKVSQLVVESGHEVAEQKPDETLRGRADSFIVETNVHYPTDMNLLWDAMRCTVRESAALADSLSISGWRQHHYVTRQIKKRFNRVRSSTLVKKSPERVQEYLSYCEKYLQVAEATLKQAEMRLHVSILQHAKAVQIQGYITDAKRQIDQITRRVFNGEKIPHDEKVFSIFQPHTRWNCKGKAGVSQELGLPVCVVEDQYKFVLHHKTFWKGGDVDHAVAVIAEAQERFPQLVACSFDKGFHSPANQIELAEMLEECALPRKGYLSAAASEHESQQWFKEARKKHPGIESAINHLEHCGLDRVLDHGQRGFERAVALSVLAANVKRLGRIIRDKQRKELARQQRLRAA